MTLLGRPKPSQNKKPTRRKGEGRSNTALPLLSMLIGLICSCASGGGISGTSVVYGPIEGFGSVIVGDVAFDTTTAVITIEGDLAEEGDLALGMVVVVRGAINDDGLTGVADRVAADHLVEAPVEGVNAADGTFTTASQLVITNAGTVFENTAIGTLAPGDNVEVFGFRSADDSIVATRVERKAVIEEIEVTGNVANLDLAAMTFELGLLTVDFSGALLEDLPTGGLVDGLLVSAEADVEVPPVDDVMIAVGVEVLDPNLMAEAGDTIDVEGVVEELVGPVSFVVNGGQLVQFSDTTVFIGGSQVDVVPNTRVEVEGEFDASRTIIASEIEIIETPL